MSSPTGITIGEDGKIYFVDTANNRIVRIDDMTGKGWTTLGTGGNGEKEFFHPHGIAVGKDGKIYVADLANSRIVQMDDITGKGWAALGTKGSGEKQFYYPHAVAVGDDGKIYVTDTYNYRIVRIDDITGKGWVSFGTPGLGEKEFASPQGIALGTDGKIYAADTNADRIAQMDDITGKGWTTISTKNPLTVAISSKQILYAISGFVITESTLCPAGKEGCSSQCVDLQTNAQHCGKCGNPCGANETCQAGACIQDSCPNDPDKTEPGVCGCGTPDTATNIADDDGDGLVNCKDKNPTQGCPCFVLADVTQAKTSTDAQCQVEQPLQGEPDTSFTGVIYPVGLEMHAVGAAAHGTTTLTYVCAKGCVDCTPSADQTITQAEYQACVELASSCSL